MTNYHFLHPEPVVCTGDVTSNWKIFTEAFADYSTATELTSRGAGRDIENGDR